MKQFEPNVIGAGALAAVAQGAWVDVSWASIALAGACAAMIVADFAVGRRQTMGVMYLVWPLTALYGSVLALAAYWTIGRSKSGHEHNRRPMWRSTLLGATHCGAGCMLGDIIADSVIFLLGGTVLFGSELLAFYLWDFVAAYLLGIAFQYFAIVPMRNLPPGRGIREAIKADTLSLIAFQVGMYAWMAIFHELIFHPAPRADSPVFWFMMQIGMAAGLATTYPMNWLLIRAGIKEGM